MEFSTVPKKWDFFNTKITILFSSSKWFIIESKGEPTHVCLTNRNVRNCMETDTNRFWNTSIYIATIVRTQLWVQNGSTLVLQTISVFIQFCSTYRVSIRRSVQVILVNASIFRPNEPHISPMEAVQMYFIKIVISVM